MAEIRKKRNSNIARVDPDFVREMRELAKFRYLKNLEKKEPTTSEMTKLLRRTDAWKQAQFELRNKPRKEELK